MNKAQRAALTIAVFMMREELKKLDLKWANATTGLDKSEAESRADKVSSDLWDACNDLGIPSVEDSTAGDLVKFARGDR
jgi:hypothetical protein